MLFIGNARSVVNIICSGMLERHPTLQIVSVESGAGWVPFVLEALEYEMAENAPADFARAVAHAARVLPAPDLRDDVVRAHRPPAPRASRLGEDRILFETRLPAPDVPVPGSAAERGREHARAQRRPRGREDPERQRGGASTSSTDRAARGARRSTSFLFGREHLGRSVSERHHRADRADHVDRDERHHDQADEPGEGHGDLGRDPDPVRHGRPHAAADDEAERDADDERDRRRARSPGTRSSRGRRGGRNRSRRSTARSRRRRRTADRDDVRDRGRRRGTPGGRRGMIGKSSTCSTRSTSDGASARAPKPLSSRHAPSLVRGSASDVDVVGEIGRRSTCSAR